MAMQELGALIDAFVVNFMALPVVPQSLELTPEGSPAQVAPVDNNQN